MIVDGASEQIAGRRRTQVLPIFIAPEKHWEEARRIFRASLWYEPGPGPDGT
jgi:DTW domain-containing protein YfiP